LGQGDLENVAQKLFLVSVSKLTAVIYLNGMQNDSFILPEHVHVMLS